MVVALPPIEEGRQTMGLTCLYPALPPRKGDHISLPFPEVEFDDKDR